MIGAIPLADDDCYLALKARDARFDGSFFTGVTSTGIYCRPVCSVKAPKRENCRFFRHAAQAESAGFRPCLRCRPELAPQLPQTAAWSTQDASTMLANQAARLLDEPEGWSEGAPSVEKLAVRLGVSNRHLRRIFDAQFGVSPLQYLQTRRLHTAKQLLTDTALPITRIALMSGYQSVRRFNAAFAGHYKLNPTQLRRGQLEDANLLVSAETGSACDPTISPCSTIRLGYRLPYDVAGMLGFFSKRAINAIESIADCAGRTVARRTFGIETGNQQHTGWLQLSFDEQRAQLVLQVSDSLRDVLPLVIRRVRAMLDLDADPAAINAVLHEHFPAADGLRVPGSLDGFELAVRAVLGQQVTVAAARTLAQRLVEKFGEPIPTPWPELNRLFPSPAALAGLDLASGDTLGQLGIVRQRQAAIVGIARALLDQRLQLHGGADFASTVETLKRLPGVGDWTAQYIAMRALRWPDAFTAGDVALQKALGVQAAKNPAKAAEAASSAWKPWRSYAVIRVWNGSWGGLAAPAASMPETVNAIESVATNENLTVATGPKSIKNSLKEPPL
jgi:AraC family transcriptional regulator of adaptative response / DNA-3-methyladenine glycosylase II